MESIWSNVPRARFGGLVGKKSTDILIIGGGITGVLCAYKLQKAGVDCILAEADAICNGITKNTTAKITLGHGLVYDKLIKLYGYEKAKLYLDAQTKAGEEYARICSSIDCDYEKQNSYVYSLNNREKIEKEVIALNSLKFGASFFDKCNLPFEIAGAVCVENQAQFNPLKFLYHIAKELPVYENTKVIQLVPNIAITNHGEISYKKIIVATHFPIFNKHGFYFLKMYQHRSYVLALQGAPQVDGMYADESDTGFSFRNYNGLLLLGGGGHRTGKKGGCWQELEEFANKYYKNAKIVGRWATQDCKTLDGIPYIGQYSKNMPDIFVATGFNKWGMTNSLVSANILCDLVQGKENKYAPVFSPSRSNWHSHLFINAFESTVGLLTPTAPRCPHLGCALKYNKAEHSWDCPCHGSRFTESGELIDNPATDDKKM